MQGGESGVEDKVVWSHNCSFQNKYFNSLIMAICAHFINGVLNIKRRAATHLTMLDLI